VTILSSTAQAAGQVDARPGEVRGTGLVPGPNISFVPHYSAPTQSIPLRLVPELLRSPVIGNLVEPLRHRFETVSRRAGLEAAKKAIREEKAHLPAVLPCGVFGIRKIVGLELYSGIVPLDFDGFNSVASAGQFKLTLAADPHLFLVFISPSGRGVKAFLNVPDRKHSLNYEMAVCYCLEQWDMMPDPSGKDVSRLCFLSYDPAPVWNPTPELLQFNHHQWMRETRTDARVLGHKNRRYAERDPSDDDNAEVVDDRNQVWAGREADYALVKAAVDAIDPGYAEGYNEWLHVGFALHWWGRKVGQPEKAKGLFHTFSAKSRAKYNANEVDEKWAYFENSSRWLDTNAVTIGTVFHFAVESGFEFPGRGKDWL
jgi:hypothetical protein